MKRQRRAPALKSVRLFRYADGSLDASFASWAEVFGSSFSPVFVGNDDGTLTEGASWAPYFEFSPTAAPSAAPTIASCDALEAWGLVPDAPTLESAEFTATATEVRAAFSALTDMAAKMAAPAMM